MIEIATERLQPRSFLVIGIGGAGNALLNHLVCAGTRDVQYLSVTSDEAELSRSLAPRRYHLGHTTLQGSSTGGDPEVGRAAAEDGAGRLRDIFQQVSPSVVFLLAGMGGGTGTGATPILAALAREVGALVIGIVTMPFVLEGRDAKAHVGLEALRLHVDLLHVLSNEAGLAEPDAEHAPLFGLVTREATKSVIGARALLDLQHILDSVSDLRWGEGRVTLDLAHLKSVLKAGGPPRIGVGVESGEEALERALAVALAPNASSEFGVAQGARVLLLNIATHAYEPPALGVVHRLLSACRTEMAEDGEIFLGHTHVSQVHSKEDPTTVRVTVVASNFL